MASAYQTALKKKDDNARGTGQWQDLNAGKLKEPKSGMFKELQELSEKYKRVNQYE